MLANPPPFGRVGVGSPFREGLGGSPSFPSRGLGWVSHFGRVGLEAGQTPRPCRGGEFLSLTSPAITNYSPPYREGPGVGLSFSGGAGGGSFLFVRAEGGPPPSGGLGRGCLFTLHHNILSSNELHRAVKFFYLLQLFNDTISTHSEMYHHSVLVTFIA